MKNKKPKICFVTSFFYPVIGGVESHILNKSLELIKLGYDVEVFVSDRSREGIIEKKQETYKGIKIKRFPAWFKFSFSGIFFPGLFKGVRESNADIFHVHGYRHPFNFIFLCTKKPLFITPHWPVYFGQRKKWQQIIVDLTDKFLGRYIFKNFTKVCTVTGLENSWVESFNVPKKNIVITPNAIPENYFKKYNGRNFRKKYSIKNEIVILTMSRIHSSKGIDQIINVAKFFPKVKFIIAGRDGGEEKNLRELAKELKLKNVIFAGEQTEKQKLEAYAGADIFCSPSHYEGFCISILEAMSQGCAVLTSNQGGMPWVVGKTGLIFKDNNLNDLKNKLKKLIENKKLREKFQKGGLEKVKRFKWKNIAKILDKEYKKVLNIKT